jgi:hypothetical protein
LVILRERFGMTYRQAEFEEPAWYVDMLLAHHRAERHALEVAAAQQAAEAAEIERTETEFMQQMKAAGLDT